METPTTDGIRLSALNPRYLQSNSTSHTWPFSAFAELIDNAYDPDVNAKQIWIDQSFISGLFSLIFMDNGNGMNLDKLHKMLSFGFSDKVTVQGHVPVGLYGNGFKSGSMRLGKDAIVLTKNESGMHVGMLSQTYLEAVNAEHVIVPIISFNKQKQLVKTRDSDANLQAIIGHSILKTEEDLLTELDVIPQENGTRIIIWNLRRDKIGNPEFDFMTDKYDLRIPEEIDESARKKYKKQERPDSVAPDSDYSLRAYCSILYLKPRMQIILRGQKVQAQYVSKNLAHIEKDVYRPKSKPHKPVKITFGYNCRNKEHYGIMMYHKNRLIKAYMRVGCQLKANNMGVGVVGVIECNNLTPTHNKQDFDYTDEYRLTMKAVGDKLNEYWDMMKEKKNTLTHLPVEDEQKCPDQNWAQCDSCLKWRKLPDDVGDLPEDWFCNMNPDPQFRDCNVPEEPEDDEEITHSTYKKTPKKKKSEGAAQKSSRPSTTANPSLAAAETSVQPGTPPKRKSERMAQKNSQQSTTANSSPLEAAKTSVQPGTPPKRKSERVAQNNSRLATTANPSTLEATETSVQPGTPSKRVKRKILTETSDEEVDNGDMIIMEDVSTPKPMKGQPQNGAGPSPVPMETLDGETSGMLNTAGIEADTQNEVPGIMVKKEDDMYGDFQGQQEMESQQVCTTTDNYQNQVNGDTDYYKKRCEQLSNKPTCLEETSGQQVKMVCLGDIQSKYDQALKENSRLNILYKKVHELLGLSSSSTGCEIDDMAIQLGEVFQKFDSCSAERDQCKTEIEQLQLEKKKLEAWNYQLQRELQQLKKAASGNSASTSVSGEDRATLRTYEISLPSSSPR